METRETIAPFPVHVKNQGGIEIEAISGIANADRFVLYATIAQRNLRSAVHMTTGDETEICISSAEDPVSIPAFLSLVHGVGWEVATECSRSTVIVVGVRRGEQADVSRWPRIAFEQA